MAYHALARRFKFLIESYSRHGAGHVIEVFRQERIRRAYARAPEPLPDPERFRSQFSWRTDQAPFIESFYRAVSPRLPISRASRKDFFIQLLLTLQGYDQILDDAERFSEGKFTALGVMIDEPSGVYDWHRDYSSGKVWEKLPFDRIRYGDGDGSDVKYVWELSRMYWIGWLGKAYWITGNGTWAREFTRRIDEWRQANPINVGVNWAMPMEVGIRGFWLTIGFAMFHGAPEIDDAWWEEYLRLVWGHGAYLERNLEYFSNLTNHYIANCLGLVAVGAFFPGSPRAARWLAEGRRGMIAELDHQVLADGVHYERSICYHRLVLEMYLIAMALLERAGSPLPPEARGAVERMAVFLRDYLPPAGTVPQLGDSDDGVILRLSEQQELYDHRDTLALAAAMFGRNDLFAAAGGYSQAALLMAGSGPFESLRPIDPPQRHSTLHSQGGFASLRSEDLHLFADVGPIGLHGNNDTLSFTLSGPSGPIIVDPGTFCYTRNQATRNELRATGAHNGPCIDGKEIAEFDGLWRVKKDRTNTRVLQWDPAADLAGQTTLEGEHQAYRTLPGNVIVRRRWILHDRKIEITDSIDGTGMHHYAVRFTIPKELAPRLRDASTIEATDGNGGVFALRSTGPLEISEGWYSPSYGVAAEAIWIDARFRGEAPFSISYICSFSGARG